MPEQLAQQRLSAVYIVQPRPDQHGVRGIEVLEQCLEAGGAEGAARGFAEADHAGFRKRDSQRHGHGFRHGERQPACAGTERSGSRQQGGPGSAPRTADHQHGAARVLVRSGGGEGPVAQQRRRDLGGSGIL